MAVNNSSANCVVLSEFRNDINILSTISVFDELRDRLVKEVFIQAFKNSEKEPYKEMGYFLEHRYMEPPEVLPDKSILSADVISMGRAQLKAWADDARFLIALKYNTYL